MKQRRVLSLLAVLGLAISNVLSTCVSYGSNYVDQGGPYCIDTLLSDYWSFSSMFEGCSAGDVQGVVDPNPNEYFCSDIEVNPDDTTFISTCNVPGWEITKNSTVSGVWTVVVEDLTFAYQRSFNVFAAPPVVVVSTPPATSTVTTTPTMTVTSTNIVVNLITLGTVTVTSPPSTITKTSTVFAGPAAVWSTMTMTETVLTLANSASIKPITAATSCKTTQPAWDPTKVIQLTSRKAAAAAAATVLSRGEPGCHLLQQAGYWGGHYFDSSDFNSSE